VEAGAEREGKARLREAVVEVMYGAVPVPVPVPLLLARRSIPDVGFGT
jgi:hypothetical protein